MGNKNLIALSIIFILGLTVSAKAREIKKEAFEKTGWVELNGVRYLNNFWAMGEIEYYESVLLFDIKSKIITAVYITDYKFCSPEIRNNVPWTSTGGKLRLLKIDSEYRFNRNNPLYTTGIIGHSIWLEFPGYID